MSLGVVADDPQVAFAAVSRSNRLDHPWAIVLKYALLGNIPFQRFFMLVLTSWRVGVIQERAVRTRAQVLDAAAEEFATHGYLGTTLLGVVQRTGMTKGALYGHFSSKEDLATALLAEAGDKLIERATQRTGQGSTALPALRANVLDLARQLRRDAPAQSALRLAVEAPHLDRSGPGLVERIRLLLTHAVTEAQAGRRTTGRCPPETIAGLLMSAFFGIPHPVPRDDVDAARRFDDLWEALSGQHEDSNRRPDC
jgi:AcrR family transcriptional regulator